MRVRSVASWQPLPENICGRLASGEDLVAAGIADARMGGDLPENAEASAGPYIAVWAQQDPEGYPLQAIDIIKGYVDGAGEGKVRVFNSQATTSQPVNLPARESCAVEVGNHP
ncbi:MAG: DUF3604 domain-containing protein, partial [Nevskiales bacterium]